MDGDLPYYHKCGRAFVGAARRTHGVVVRPAAPYDRAMSGRYPELANILKKKSLKRGRFTLASGKTSDYYIDARLCSLDPEGALRIADAILKEIEGMKADAVGG